MKKIYFLFLSFICLSCLSVYADSPCDSEMQKTSKSTCPRCHKQHKYYTYAPTKTSSCQKPCEKMYNPPPTPSFDSCSSSFLCTKRDMKSLFRCMNLSETQICNAQKIQNKYEQEVLSLNERIKCENEKYYELKNNCSKNSELRKQKRLIKKLEKKRKEICKCYEKQFEVTLSSMQRKAYRKAKK